MPQSITYAELMGGYLRERFGLLRGAEKVLARKGRCSPRTAENWLRAESAPAGEAIQANTAILQALGATDESEPVAVVFPADGTMPQPSRRDGEPPCGECHLQDGEVCDICGAVSPATDQGGAE